MNKEPVPSRDRHSALRPLARSPLAIFTAGLSFAFLYACVYDSSVGRARLSTDESGAEAPAEANPGEVRTEGGTEAEDAPSGGADSAEPEGDTTIRTGPRVRHPRPDDVPHGVDIALEDRDGRSMEAFHAALRRAERGEGQARVIFYGASHVASDLFTGRIRRRLQRRFGDAGHGFVLPVHPWRSYRHRDVRIRSTRSDWESTKVRGNTREIDHFGLHGVFVETTARNAWGEVSTASAGDFGRKVSSFELFYLRQPRGGDLHLFVDGRRVERLRTRTERGETAGPGYARVEVPDGPHTFMARTRGNGAVRLFGVAMERDRPGVVVDTLGINGARARYHLLWEDAMYREHLHRRRPDLVVLAYGTNESGDELPIARYEEQLRAVVGRVRETVPNASCLLVGPSDRPVEVDEDEYQDRPRTAQLVEAQHRVAVEMGCAFFDLVAFMGGPLSMVTWSAADPAYGAPDHVHFTRRGYLRLGDVLHDALMEGFEPLGAESEAADPEDEDEVGEPNEPEADVPDTDDT